MLTGTSVESDQKKRAKRKRTKFHPRIVSGDAPRLSLIVTIPWQFNEDPNFTACGQRFTDDFEPTKGDCFTSLPVTTYMGTGERRRKPCRGYT